MYPDLVPVGDTWGSALKVGVFTPSENTVQVKQNFANRQRRN